MTIFRRMIFWIVIPAASGIFAGFLLGTAGANNWIIALYALTIILCIVETFVERTKEWFSIVLWIPELLTGFLFGKVLVGLLVGMSTGWFTACVVGFGIMVVYTISYAREILKNIDPEEEEVEEESVEEEDGN